MNDPTRRQLMIAVERVVRPVRASVARKRRMREELMAHLTSIYDEEARLFGGEADALARAARRLGEPAELTAQLQQTVPAWDILVRVDQSLLDYRFGEPVLRRAVRLAALMFAGVALVFTVFPVLIFWLENKSTDVLTLWFLLVGVVAPTLSTLTFAFTILEHGMRSAVHSAYTPRRGLAIFIGLASFVVIPATTFLADSILTGDSIWSGMEAALAAGLAILAPPILYLAAGQIAEELRYQEEWATLDVG